MFTTFEIAPLPRPYATDDNGSSAVVPVIVDTFIASDGEVYTHESNGMHAWDTATDRATRATESGARHLSRIIGERCLITGEDNLWVQR